MMKWINYIIFLLLLSLSAYSMMPKACDVLTYTPMMEVQTSIVDEEFSAFSSANYNVVQTNLSEVLDEDSDNFFQFIRTIAAKSVPSKAKSVLNKIKANKGAPPKGYKGGRTFKNYDKTLPIKDSKGNPISYKEYDVNPFQKGVNRGAERIVRGSDGKAYYTSDHYKTFTLIE